MKRLVKKLLVRQSGQITTEVMLFMAVLTGVIVFFYYLLAPPLREGFLWLAAEIIEMKH